MKRVFSAPLLAGMLAATGVAHAIDVTVDARGTFLRTPDDPGALPPLMFWLDALGTSADYRASGSQETFIGGVATDIARDFTFTNGSNATVIVPSGARYLFVGATDAIFGDIPDANPNLAVRVTGRAVPAIPEPPPWVLLLAALTGLCVAKSVRRAP